MNSDRSMCPTEHRSEEPKRVLAVMRHPLGGIRTYILYNYPTLIDAGYHFTFVAPKSERFDAFQDELREWPGVEFTEIGVHGQDYKPNSPLKFISLRHLLKSHKPCLIHSHGFNAGTAVSLANIGIGIPHLFISHGVIRSEKQFQGIVGRMKLRLLGYLLGRADKIIAVTHDAKQNYLQYLPALRGKPDKLQTIVHGIDVARFRNGRATQVDPTLRASLGIDQGSVLLGFLGRFMEPKGFLVLIEALDRMLATGLPSRKFHLLAVGSGDFEEKYRAEVERRVRLKGCVTFTGHVPDVMPVFREIDVLVMPSLWEACGLLAMEAMCAGVPVLGTDCVGLREVLEDTPSVAVPADDPEALAKALKTAIESPWTQAARDFASQAQKRFDIRPAAGQLLQLFEEVRSKK